MGHVSSNAQQIAVHMFLGFIPIVKVRKAVPVEGFNWAWGSWGLASFADITALNAELMKTWRA